MKLLPGKSVDMHGEAKGDEGVGFRAIDMHGEATNLSITSL